MNSILFLKNRITRICSVLLITAAFCCVFFVPDLAYADSIPRLSDKKFDEAVVEMTGEYKKPVTRAQAERNPYITQRLIVKSMDSYLDPEEYGAVDAAQDKEGVYILQFSSSAKARQAQAKLAKEEETLYVEPDYAVFTVEDDTAQPSEMNITSLQAASEDSVQWDVSAIGMNVYSDYVLDNNYNTGAVVAVLDTGISFGHPFISDRILTSKAASYVDGASADEDKETTQASHGTHVAGTITACTPGLNVKILPVRVLNSEDGSGSVTSLVSGIDYAVDQGADVINISMAGYLYWRSRNLEDHIKKAVDAGTVVVVSAGNENANISKFYIAPAYISDCIVVGSAGQTKDRSTFSNYGKTLDVVAPGEKIYSSILLESGEYGYAYMSGTSMSAPHVSAQAAVLSMVYSSASAAEIETMIQEMSEDLGSEGRDDYYGYGFLSLSRFVTYDPGEHGSFSEVSYETAYGDETPGAPTPVPENGYTFTGWSPSISKTVTEDITYTAQWQASSQSGSSVSADSSSSSGSSIVSDNSSSTSGTSGSTGGSSASSGSTGGGSTSSGSSSGGSTSSGSSSGGSTSSGSSGGDSSSSGNVTDGGSSSGSGSDSSASPDNSSGSQGTSDSDSINLVPSNPADTGVTTDPSSGNAAALYSSSNPHANVTDTVPLKKKQKTAALKVLGLSGGDHVVSWTVSDTSRITVAGNSDGTCIVTAGKKTGKASITAITAGNKEIVFQIKVQKKKIKTKKIQIESKKITLSAGETMQLEPVLYPVTSTDKVKYRSKNKKVVTVTGKGVLKAKSSGKATVIITSGKKKIRLKITVK